MATQIFEAPTVPCNTCGAPLPVDPSAPQLTCPMCRHVTAVPRDVLERAWHYDAQLRSAHAAHVQQHAYARGEWQQAQKQSSSATWTQVWLGMSVVGALITLIPAGLGSLVGLYESLNETFVPWAATAIVVVVAAVAALVLAAIGIGCWAFYRFVTRHKRNLTRATQATATYGQRDTVRAVCSVCGGPITFRIGQQSVTCTHCQSVVIPAVGHRQKLVALALQQVQVAEFQAARARRVRLRAELKQRRSQAMITAYRLLGVGALLFAPVVAILYVWRAVTRSVEQHMEELADRLQGQIGAGLDPIFEWLDDFWVGDAPAGLMTVSSAMTVALESCWSIETVFHGHPVLIVAQTNWTDRTAKRVFVLLAHPAVRGPELLGQLAQAGRAQQLQSLGCCAYANNAGAVIEGAELSARLLTADRFTVLTQAAHELALFGTGRHVGQAA